MGTDLRDPNEASNRSFELDRALDRDASREPTRTYSRLTAAQRARYDAMAVAARTKAAAPVSLSLQAAPPVISNSLLTVLVAHGYTITHGDGTLLSDEDYTAVVKECGANASQALYSLVDDGDEPGPDDMVDAPDPGLQESTAEELGYGVGRSVWR